MHYVLSQLHQRLVLGIWLLLVLAISRWDLLFDAVRPIFFKRVHRCENEEQVITVKRAEMRYKVEETKTVESTDHERVAANGAAQPPTTTMQHLPCLVVLELKQSTPNAFLRVSKAFGSGQCIPSRR